MKRLFIVASMAIMAVGCQKTTVENEVLTPIGFNTEVSKLTRATVAYEGTEFGVFSYANQNGALLNRPMENVKIENVAEIGSPAVWKNKTTSYYWPNDANTTLDFYAYSPFMAKEGETEKITHTKETGFQMSDYTHNMSTDFMVSDAVVAQKYNEEKKGVVDLVFNHQMAKVQFKVVAEALADVTFDVTSITLNNIAKVADYIEIPTSGNKWSVDSNWGSALDATPAGFELTLTGDAGKETSTPVTVIPESLTGKTFTVKYTIRGTGVAKEDVVKTLPLAYAVVKAPVTEWVANKSITYTLTVGLKQITFAPVVEDWEPVNADSIDIN